MRLCVLSESKLQDVSRGKSSLQNMSKLCREGWGDTDSISGRASKTLGWDEGAVVASEEGIGYGADTPFLLHVCTLYGHNILPRAHIHYLSMCCCTC